MMCNVLEIVGMCQGMPDVSQTSPFIKGFTQDVS